MKKDTKPIVYITPICYSKIMSLTKLAEGEIGGFLLIENNVISDVIVPPQKVTSGSVDIEAKDMAVLMSTELKDKDELIRGQWHSHGNMGAFSSVIDDKFFNDWGNISGMDFPYMIEVVTNKNMDVLCKMILRVPIELEIECDLTIKMNTENMDGWAKTEIDKKIVKTKTDNYQQQKQLPPVEVLDYEGGFGMGYGTNFFRRDFPKTEGIYHIQNKITIVYADKAVRTLDMVDHYNNKTLKIDRPFIHITDIDNEGVSNFIHRELSEKETDKLEYYMKETKRSKLTKADREELKKMINELIAREPVGEEFGRLTYDGE